MSFLTFDEIHRLIGREASLYKDNDKISHLKSCFDIIDEKFMALMQSKRYQFHRAFYIDDAGKFVSVPLNNKFVNKQVERAILGIEKEIRDHRLISFTELLSKSTHQGLCLYRQADEPVHPPIGSFDNFLYYELKGDLDTQQITDYFADDSPVTRERINSLVHKYQVMSEFVCPIYIYFLRPFTNFEHYNGTLNLIVQSPLSDAELIELGLLWTKLLSDTAIIETRNREQELIFQEHNHAWSTQLRSLEQNLETVDSYFMRHPDIPKAVRDHMDMALIRMEQLHHTMTFNLVLMKAYNPTEIVRPDIQKYMEVKYEDVSLRDLLCSAIDTVSVLLINEMIASPVSAAKKEACLLKMKEKLQSDAPYMVYAIPIALQIIFNDLLKNALDHARGDQLFIDIRIIPTQDRLELHFINSTKLTGDMHEFINDLSVREFKTSLSRKFGIRTIKRIINSPLFDDGKTGWQLSAVDPKDTDVTDIFLTLINKTIKK